MLPRGMLVGGTGSAAELPSGEALAAGAADATVLAAGTHGGGGHAVCAAVGSGAGAAVAEAEPDATADPAPIVFSGAMTGGSPSHPRREATGAAPARTTRVTMLFRA